MNTSCRAFLTAFVSVAAIGLAAQTMVYRSVADHQNKRGEDMGEYVDIAPVMGQYVLFFNRKGEEVKVRCKDIWGFVYKGVLFRTGPDGHAPVRLMTKGAVCYYENGFAHLTMQRDRTEHAGYDTGHASYLSRHLEGEVVPAVFKNDDKRSASARFRQAHPQFEKLFVCIGDTNEMDNTRQCVVDFEASLEGP